MMIRIKSNLKSVLARFTKKQRAMMKTRKMAHRDIAIMLDRWVLRNFRSQGGSVGGWTPFAVYCVGGPRSPYKKVKTCGRGRVLGKGKKRRLDKTAKLLQDTGRLRASFKLFYSDDDAGIGSNLDYAPPHERGQGHLPQRRMLPNDREVRRDITRIYENHIKKALKK